MNHVVNIHFLSAIIQESSYSVKENCYHVRNYHYYTNYLYMHRGVDTILELGGAEFKGGEKNVCTRKFLTTSTST